PALAASHARSRPDARTVAATLPRTKTAARSPPGSAWSRSPRSRPDWRGIARPRPRRAATDDAGPQTARSGAPTDRLAHQREQLRPRPPRHQLPYLPRPNSYSPGARTYHHSTALPPRPTCPLSPFPFPVSRFPSPALTSPSSATEARRGAAAGTPVPPAPPSTPVLQDLAPRLSRTPAVAALPRSDARTDVGTPPPTRGRSRRSAPARAGRRSRRAAADSFNGSRWLSL